jgi:putative membrane protein
MKTLWLILVNAVILYLSTLLIPEGIQSDSFTTTLWAAAIVAGCNVLIFRTIIGMLFAAIPLMLSAVLGQLGVLFMLFSIESLFLYTADWMLDGFSILGFWWAMLVVLFLSIGNKMFISPTKK